MEKTINIRIAANDKLKIIEEKLFMEKLAIAMLIILTIISYFGIQLQIGIILGLIIIWFYKKDLKEKTRMRDVYAI